MSLKTDYLNGSTGIQNQLDLAFAAGATLVSTNLSAISTALIANAALGLTTFTINVVTSFNPVGLRGNKGNNLLAKAYFAGIQDGLAAEAIYEYECAPVLNTSDTVSTSVDLNFTFATI